jgi:hypothetical protein
MNENILRDNVKNDTLRVPNSPIEQPPKEAEPPMERIPIEILTLIFEECVIMDMSPWNLTKVCRAWKQVALSTPTLWKVLAIMQRGDKWFVRHCSLDDDGNENFYNGRRSVCSKEEQLQRYLRRCTGAPLDVLIRCVEDDEEQTKELVQCLKVLMVPSVTERIRKLYLYLPSQLVTRAWPECFQHARLHNIERLNIYPRISSRWTEDIFKVMFNTTSLREDQSESTPPSTLSQEHLTKLRDIGISASAQELNQIVARITQVEKIGHPPMDWPDGETPKVTFSNLVELDIRTNPFDFRRIQLPSLQDLVVRDGRIRGFDETAVPDATSLPNLIRFQVNSQFPRQWLSNISIPNLDILAFDFERKRVLIVPELFHNTSLSTFTKTRQLILRHFVDYGSASSILEVLPSVTNLVVSGLRFDRGGLDTLVQRMTEFDQRFLCAPNLKEIAIYNDSRGISEEATPFSTLIRDLISLRRQHNCALQAITWIDRWAPGHYKDLLKDLNDVE